MSKDEIIAAFELTAKLIGLHEDNVFKARAYEQAAQNLEKYYGFFPNASALDLESAISKAMSVKAVELRDGTPFLELEALLKQTPQGILDLLSVPGLGSKKVRALWNEHSIDDLPKLKTSIETGILAGIKGFGQKSVDAIAKALEFQDQQEGLLYMETEAIVERIGNVIDGVNEKTNWDWVGQWALEMPVITKLELLIATEKLESLEEELLKSGLQISIQDSSPAYWAGSTGELPLYIYHCSPQQFFGAKFRLSTGEGHLLKKGVDCNLIQASYGIEESELDIYNKAGLPFIPKTMRNGTSEWEWYSKYGHEAVVQDQDLKGILHNHSTYSDGKNTLAEMAQACIEQGYEYFGICDHSWAANFYANGMPEERVIQQWAEIEKLNAGFSNFKIFKGIEADILNDGTLDYGNEFLKGFDFVVASVHGNLKMSKTEATDRIITAVNKPATTILGHSSGRLLLKREGYALDYDAVFKAAKENEVVIEINAHPRRLDLDWSLVYKAMDMGIMLSINPDAHEVAGLWLMKYGTKMAQKAGLLKRCTLNAMTVSEIDSYFQNRKNKRVL